MLREKEDQKRKAQSSLTRSVDVSGGGSIIPCSFANKAVLVSTAECFLLFLSFFFLYIIELFLLISLVRIL